VSKVPTSKVLLVGHTNRKKCKLGGWEIWNLERKWKKGALMKVIKGIIQALKDTITGLLQSMLLVGAVLAGTDLEIFLHLSYTERERERERESVQLPHHHLLAI
jgi:hypothetical protein